MKDLFLCLLMGLKDHGNITEANLYDEKSSSIRLVEGDSEYLIFVSKKEVEKNDA